MNFSPSTADYWTAALPNLLEGKSLQDLDDGQVGRPVSVDANYLIGAYVDEGSYGEINRYALAELERGAEALLFRLYRQPDKAAIGRILKGIDATETGLHCSLRYPGQDPAELFRDLVRYLRSQRVDLKKVTGSVDFDPLLDWSDPPFPPLIRLLGFVEEWMPGFAVLQVNAAGFNNGTDLADTEIALSLAKGAEYLREVQEHGYSPTTAAKHLKFAITVGTSFHGDVAKLRALRSLWPKVLAEFNVTTPPPTIISAHTDVTTLGNSWEENKELLTRQAQSMVLGGADIAFLTPLEQVDDTPTVRARNYTIDLHTDLRGTGSGDRADTTFDTITQELTRAAWNKYEELVRKGGFATAVEI